MGDEAERGAVVCAWLLCLVGWLVIGRGEERESAERAWDVGRQEQGRERGARDRHRARRRERRERRERPRTREEEGARSPGKSGKEKE